MKQFLQQQIYYRLHLLRLRTISEHLRIQTNIELLLLYKNHHHAENFIGC